MPFASPCDEQSGDPGCHSEHEARPHYGPPRGVDRLQLEAIAGIPDQMSDAAAQMQEKRKGYAEQNDATVRARVTSFLQESFGGMFPFSRFEELGKQNMAFLEQAMRMWNPFKGPAGNAAPAAKPSGENLDALKSQMDALQRQLDTLTRQKKES